MNFFYAILSIIIFPFVFLYASISLSVCFDQIYKLVLFLSLLLLSSVISVV